MVSSKSLFRASCVLLVLALHCGSTLAAASPAPGTLIFARQNPGCVQDCAVPTCNCSADEDCQMIAQTCDSCSKVQCNAKTTSSTSKTSSGVGAIVGGLFGGLAAAGLIGFVVYTRCIKKKKARMSMAASAAEKENDFGMLKSARASTHTVASIASTVRTRASNVIQIAYIPGVTNRSGPSTPSHLVPPVPPLPGMATSPVTSQYPRSPLAGDFQFSADDILRGSMYTVNDNRSSVATTIYGQNAVVSQPNIIRAGKAAVVTVKSGSSQGSSPLSESMVPPVPTLVKIKSKKGRTKPKEIEEQPTVLNVPPSPAFSVGETFLSRMNSAKTVDVAKPVAGPSTVRAIHENHSAESFVYDSDDSDDDIQPGSRLKRSQSACSSCITDMDTGSPFSDSRSPFSDVNTVAIDNLLAPASSRLPPDNHSRGSPADVAQVPERTVSPFDDSNTIDKATR